MFSDSFCRKTFVVLHLVAHMKSTGELSETEISTTAVM